MDAVGALRLSPLRRGLAIDSTVDIFTFYVPHRHVYGEQWIKFMKDGVNATPLPTVNRSEERFSRNAETDLVCRLLLEKKKKKEDKKKSQTKQNIGAISKSGRNTTYAQSNI